MRGGSEQVRGRRARHGTCSGTCSRPQPPGPPSPHTFLVIASGGGSGLTDRQQPTSTWRAAGGAD